MRNAINFLSLSNTLIKINTLMH